MSLIFDPDAHIYTADGVAVPSVTQLLPEQDFHCTIEQLETARLDGIERHSMMKMYNDTGKSYGDEFLIALDAWIATNAMITGKLIAYEVPLYSARHRYAGKPDMIFERAIVDLKRGPGNKKIHALQLAAYHLLAVENKIIGKNKMHLVIWHDGDIKGRNVYDNQAEDIFLSLVKKYYISEGVDAWMRTA